MALEKYTLIEKKMSDDTFLTPDPHPTDETVGWGWRAVALVVALTIVGAFAIFFLTTQYGAQADGSLSPLVAFLAGIAIYGVILAGIYLFAARRSGWAALGWRPVSWQVLVATPALLIVGLFGIAAINLTIAVLQGGTFENPQSDALTGGSPLSQTELLLGLLLVAGIVPVAEELLFRGMIYPLLRHRGAVFAIVISAALFSLVHFIPLLLPALFFIGLLLGLLREWSKSVIPCILFHALQNGIGLLAINAAVGMN